jgi:hypothetical protein
VAKRKCAGDACGIVFTRKVKDMEKIKNMGETNITDQRKMMESRVSCLSSLPPLQELR